MVQGDRMRTSCLGLLGVLFAVPCAHQHAISAEPPVLWEAYHDSGWHALTRGELGDADFRLRKALEIAQAFPSDDPRKVLSYGSMAWLLVLQGRASEAEPLARWALAIRERHQGSNHLDVAFELNTLAVIARRLGRYAEAESLYKRALTIKDRARVPEFGDIAVLANNLGYVYFKEGKRDEALGLFERALSLRERTFGPESPEVTLVLNNLAEAYLASPAEPAQAERLARRAFAIVSEKLDPTHVSAARSLDLLGRATMALGKANEAEPMFQRCLIICEHELPAAHPLTANALEHFASLLRQTGRQEEAKSLEGRAQTIRTQLHQSRHDPNDDGMVLSFLPASAHSR